MRGESKGEGRMRGSLATHIRDYFMKRKEEKGTRKGEAVINGKCP